MSGHLYETHLTLASSDAPNLSVLETWSKSKGIKWTHIVLDRGCSPLQPMLTFWGRGTLEMQRQRARDLATELHQQGASVVRVKIETATDSDEARSGKWPNGYFEHHVKLLLNSDNSIDSLTQLAVTHGARLSRNARRQRPDGQVERFVTQRVYGTNREQAASLLKTLLATLQDSSFKVLEVESEFVLYDSNIALDDGWLDVNEGELNVD